jgi:hypothetical protein
MLLGAKRTPCNGRIVAVCSEVKRWFAAVFTAYPQQFTLIPQNYT